MSCKEKTNRITIGYVATLIFGALIIILCLFSVKENLHIKAQACVSNYIPSSDCLYLLRLSHEPIGMQREIPSWPTALDIKNSSLPFMEAVSYLNNHWHYLYDNIISYADILKGDENYSWEFVRVNKDQDERDLYHFSKIIPYAIGQYSNNISPLREALQEAFIAITNGGGKLLLKVN